MWASVSGTYSYKKRARTTPKNGGDRVEAEAFRGRWQRRHASHLASEITGGVTAGASPLDSPTYYRHLKPQALKP
jgi:hypothetical protein